MELFIHINPVFVLSLLFLEPVMHFQVSAQDRSK